MMVYNWFGFRFFFNNTLKFWNRLKPVLKVIPSQYKINITKIENMKTRPVVDRPQLSNGKKERERDNRK